MRSRRLELPRAFAHNDLNVARLPVPPRPLNHRGESTIGWPLRGGRSAPLAKGCGGCKRGCNGLFGAGGVPSLDGAKPGVAGVVNTAFTVSHVCRRTFSDNRHLASGRAAGDTHVGQGGNDPRHCKRRGSAGRNHYGPGGSRTSIGSTPPATRWTRAGGIPLAGLPAKFCELGRRRDIGHRFVD